MEGGQGFVLLVEGESYRCWGEDRVPSLLVEPLVGEAGGQGGTARLVVVGTGDQMTLEGGLCAFFPPEVADKIEGDIRCRGAPGSEEEEASVDCQDLEEGWGLP